MTKPLNISDYKIYTILTDEALLVAVPDNHHVRLEQLMSQYGSLEKVPASKTIRGIFVKKNNRGELELAANDEQENDITVNQLRSL